MTQSLRPPPEAAVQWIQFLTVQVVALVGLLIGGWKLLRKPIDKKLKILARRVKRLRTTFEKESFDLRTQLTGMLRPNLEQEQRIRMLEQSFERLQQSLDVNHQMVMSSLDDIKERLIHTEADVRTLKEERQ